MTFGRHDLYGPGESLVRCGRMDTNSSKKSTAQRNGNGMGAVDGIQLAQDIIAMPFNHALAQSQDNRNLPCGFPDLEPF
jgi:D-serine deaminase-like pyridoxal phosphate-dependent protein